MSDPTPPLPSELPVLPLRQTVAFPLTLQPLAVNRPVSLETVNRALGSDRLILLALQDNDTEDPGPDDIRKVGTVAIIRQMAKTASGVNIILEGLARVRLDRVTRTGELAIIVKPWAVIWLNGKRSGQTPFRTAVPVGKYRVRLVNDDVGKDETTTITVEPDKTATIERSW